MTGRPGEGHVHDPRQRHSYELRPDPTLDRAIRALAMRLEHEELLPSGASTAPRFQPHLTLARAATVAAAAVDALATSLVATGTDVSFTHAGTFGDGRIIWLAPEPRHALDVARAALLDQLDPASLDPLVHDRPWTPHVTVAYAVDEPARAAALELVREHLPLHGTWSSAQAWDLDVRPTTLVVGVPIEA